MAKNDAPTVREIQNIENFFKEIAYKLDGYPIETFTYIAVKHRSEFCLLQARVLLTQGTPQSPTHFESKHIRAGNYPLSELKLNASQLVEHLTSGCLSTPHGKLCFSPNEGGSFLATYDPIHEAGQSSQSRLDVLTILGGAVRQYVVHPLFDWELKASPTPYDSLQELAFEYSLGALRDVINLAIVAFNVAAVDPASTITSTTGKLAVRLAPGLIPKHVMLGYRVFSQGRVVKRSSIGGNKMIWEKQEALQHGRVEVEVPPAAVLHCVASYRGTAQQHYWVADPTTAPNARRVVYELADNQLEILSDLLTRPPSRGRDARELETGVAWLLWMLGFSVAHLGSTPRTQDAVDLIATTPNGHFAVIECTTGLLKADQKLPRVVERAENVRRRLAESGNRYARVLAVIVTSKTAEEVMADIEQAERLRVLVMTREHLQQYSNRTLTLPNADQLFEQAEQTVQAAVAKYEAQPQLPLPSA
jgi:hypothetical protein